METVQRYRDRRHAGQVLARRLHAELGAPVDAIVLALPRGGVPVGFELARKLDAELDVFVVRKLGVPDYEELAMGAIAAGGFEVINDAVVAELRITANEIAEVAERESVELRRRDEAFRGRRAPARVEGRTVLLVDDGLATGFTMRAAVAAIRARHPSPLIVAVPVGAPETCAEIARLADRLVCPLQPAAFRAVGLWYDDFAQTTDEEVRRLLDAAAPVPPARKT